MIVTVTPSPAFDRTVEVLGFHVGGTFRGKLLARRAAGKGVNVARCLAALGAETAATGLLARSAANEFAASLRGGGVRAAFVEIDGEIRVNTTILDPSARSETHVRERGAPVARDDIRRLEAKLAELAGPGSWTVACGSLPDGMSAEDLARVLEAARARGSRLALDSSGEGLRAAFTARPELLKPNRAELAELSGREAPSRAEALQAARALVGKAARALLVTLGAEGALYVEAGLALGARCEPEEVVNSVGAGDAALAGWLWAESRGEGPEARLASAVAAGAAKLAEGVAGELDRERFVRLRARARVERL